jgi:hypothetical protein
VKASLPISGSGFFKESHMKRENDRDDAPYGGPVRFLLKLYAVAGGVALLAYVGASTFAAPESARADATAPAADQRLPQSASEYYPGLFATPQGAPEAPVATF